MPSESLDIVPAARSPIKFDPYFRATHGLHPLPQIMAQLAAKLQDHDAYLDDISEILITDSTIVSHLIKISNSSHYNFEERAENLAEALQRIGLGEINHMVSIGVAKQVYQKELTQYRILPNDFWDSCLSGALLCESIAEPAGINSETAYLTGLMREIGKLVIDKALHNEYPSDYHRKDTPTHLWEKKACGYDHGTIGAALLKHWKFPGIVYDSVRSQWSDTNRISKMSCTLRLVNKILYQTHFNFDSSVQDWSEFDPERNALQISIDDLKTAYTYALSNYQTLRALVH